MLKGIEEGIREKGYGFVSGFRCFFGVMDFFTSCRWRIASAVIYLLCIFKSLMYIYRLNGYSMIILRFMVRAG